MKPFVKEPGWEKRVFREVCGHDGHFDPCASGLKPQNIEALNRMTFWTPEDGGENPWAEDVDSRRHVVLTDADRPSFDGMLAYMPTLTDFSWGGLDRAKQSPEEQEEVRRKAEEARIAAEKRFEKFAHAIAQAPECEAATAPPPCPRPVADIVGCLVGWRICNVFGNFLASLHQSWMIPPKHAVPAVCSVEDDHDAPDEPCSCGYYSYDRQHKAAAHLYSHEDIENHFNPRVLCSVWVWGRVVEHDNGYRSEFCYPKEIWIFDKRHAGLGQVYGVPVRHVDISELTPVVD